MGHEKSQKHLLHIIAAWVLGLLLTGCVSNQYWTWRHPGNPGQAALQQAKLECRQLAQREVNRFDFYRPYPYSYPFRYDYDYDRYRYRRYPPPLTSSYFDFHLYNLELDRLYRVCMQAKGWQAVLVTPDQPKEP